MKKICFVLFIFVGVILFGCKNGTLPEIIIEDFTKRREAIEFTISIEKTEDLVEGSCSAKIVDLSGEFVNKVFFENAEEYVNTDNELTMLKEFVYIDGMKINTEYYLEIYGTMDKGIKLLYKEKFSTNDIGSEDNKYVISSPEDFDIMRSDFREGAYYIIDNDIDFSEYGIFETICGEGVGKDLSFAGNIDGQGHTISNVSIEEEDIAYIGLFGSITGSVSNLNFENIDIVCGENTFSTLYTGLIGYNMGAITNVNITNISISVLESKTLFAGGISGFNMAKITNVEISGLDLSIDEVSDSGKIGGLFGYNKSKNDINNTEIVNTSVTGSISVIDALDELIVGGLIGHDYAPNSSIISELCKSYAMVDIDVNSSGEVIIGGLVGKAESDYEDVYALGTITFATKKMVEEVLETVTLTQITSIGGLFGTVESRTIDKVYCDVDIIASVSSTEKTHLGGIVGMGIAGNVIRNSFFLGNINANIIEVVDVENEDVIISAFDGFQQYAIITNSYYSPLSTFMLDDIDIKDLIIGIDFVLVPNDNFAVITESVYLANPDDYPGATIYETPFSEVYYRYVEISEISELELNADFIFSNLLFSGEVWEIDGTEGEILIVLK